MKNKIWLLQIPIVLLFTFAFWVTEIGIDGNLKNPFLRDTVFSFLRGVQGTFTNSKFRINGETKPKNKIVVVEIDSRSIETYGRWPWHRDYTAALVDTVMASGAKVVGLDIVFSEPDKRVPDEIRNMLSQSNVNLNLDQLETDNMMRDVIQNYKDRLVLGWATESSCQPSYAGPEGCPVRDPDRIKTHQAGFEKFSISKSFKATPFEWEKTAISSAPDYIPNIELFDNVALHSGFFNAYPDIDGYIRRTSLLTMIEGKPYPSLALEMARLGLNRTLEAEFDESHRLKSLAFSADAANPQRYPISTSPLSSMEINFRGKSRTFPYVSAFSVLYTPNSDEELRAAGRDPAAERENLAALAKEAEEARAALKDAYVLIGLTAIGVFDMRAFPFDSNTAGVEGHANILDNILSNDMLRRGSGPNSPLWLFLLMTAGALLLGYATERLESIPALLLFLTSFTGFAFFDVKVLFARNQINWNTSLFYIEVLCMFMFTIAIKYVMEERNKKFITGAFAKYVSPAIIDSIMKDPTKLSVGGEKRELTILFSDIRGFTTFSERLDAKALAGFLNDYLGIMTDIVFDNEGTLDKYIGDAVMAFWGAPLDQPKHATNACRAAVKMMQALAANRDRFKTQYGVDVNIGIGINSGAVNVGNMGSSRIFEYTVIGDHVNLASRLEGLTKYYGAAIVTSRFTFDDIQRTGEPVMPHRVLDFVKVKGKKTAVELIQILEKDYDATGLKLFEEARVLYTKQRWDQAIDKFREANSILRQHPDIEDGPSQMYIERCKEFKLQPPDADWDGSWEMHSK